VGAVSFANLRKEKSINVWRCSYTLKIINAMRDWVYAQPYPRTPKPLENAIDLLKQYWTDEHLTQEKLALQRASNDSLTAEIERLKGPSPWALYRHGCDFAPPLPEAAQPSAVRNDRIRQLKEARGNMTMHNLYQWAAAIDWAIEELEKK
jgi:hypothetical protein